MLIRQVAEIAADGRRKQEDERDTDRREGAQLSFLRIRLRIQTADSITFRGRMSTCGTLGFQILRAALCLDADTFEIRLRLRIQILRPQGQLGETED